MVDCMKSAFEMSIDFSWQEPLDAVVFYHLLGLGRRMRVFLREDGTVWAPLLGKAVQVAEFAPAPPEEKRAEVGD